MYTERKLRATSIHVEHDKWLSSDEKLINTHVSRKVMNYLPQTSSLKSQILGSKGKKPSNIGQDFSVPLNTKSTMILFEHSRVSRKIVDVFESFCAANRKKNQSARLRRAVRCAKINGVREKNNRIYREVMALSQCRPMRSNVFSAYVRERARGMR